MTELSPVEVLPKAKAYERPTVVVLEGEIGRDMLPSLSDVLFRLSHQGITQVVLDFEGVTHFDFRGVKSLVHRAELFRRVGGDLKLAGLSPYLHAIFRSAGGAGAFDFFADSGDAQTAFARGVFVSG